MDWVELGMGMIMTRRKIPITERALLQRINRKLDEKHEKVHKARGMVKEQCDFYRLNTSTNTVMKYMTRDDFEKFGRKLDAIREYEILDH